MHRAELVKLQMNRIDRRARRAADAGDQAALAACAAEQDVLLESMEAIREEQLISMLPKPKPRRRWWARRKGA